MTPTIDELDTPCVLIDAARVEANLQRAQAHADANGYALRPHIKTHKLPRLALRQVKLGAVGITVQKLGEAEVMATAGLDDIFMPYNIIGSSKLQRLRALNDRITIAVTADSPDTVAGYAETFATGRPLTVLVECDTGGGRCGVQTPAQALALARQIEMAAGLRFGGLMTYPPLHGRERSEVWLREAAALLEQAGLPVPVISSGNSPDMWETDPTIVTERRPGTYVYFDRFQVQQGAATLDDCALTVLATVVSRPTPTRVVVDAGSKSLTSDLLGLEGHGLVAGSNLVLRALSEEHGVIEMAEASDVPRIGNRLRIIPNHACVVSNLFDVVHFVNPDGSVEAVEVAARGASWLMAQEAKHGYLLESRWIPDGDGTSGTYVLTLGNHTGKSLQDFRVAVSGPMRIADDAAITGGRVLARLSNYCEIAPDAGFALAPGAEWRIEIEALEWPLRHWTEGTSGAYIILADGPTTPAFTLPTRSTESVEPLPLGTMSLAGIADQGSLSIIPWPSQVEVSGCRTPPVGFAIDAADAGAAAAADSFGLLTRLLFPGEGLVRQAGEGGLPVRCSTDPDAEAESYIIEFRHDGVAVTAARDGLLHGLVTLGQILRGARLQPHRLAFPAAGRIVDAPVHGFRGCHLDTARRFYGTDEITRFLAILAWNKLNVFHWHLSDDEAWRVEIDAYPELVRTGAWRGHGLPVPPLLGSGPEPEGGSYSKRAVSSIVGLATDFGIEIVPEVDVPGHCYAMLKALPQLRDPAETGTYRSIQGFPNNCLNPAVEETYPVLEAIFSELFDLFPSTRFHLGADEVPEDAWSGSPMAKDLLGDLGGGGAERLQAHFLSRLDRFLDTNGRTAGAWEEAAAGGGIGPAGSYLVGWRTAAAARELAAAGYQVVVAPAQAYYLDMANSADWWECGAGWAGFSSPQATYEFDPTQGWSAEERANLLGIQACIWSEPMSRPAVFDRLVFPRLSAIAETAWSAPERRDYRRFAGLAGLMPNLYGQAEELLW